MIRAFNKQIPWLVMLLFAAGALATLYFLFGLGNDLALQAGVLAPGEAERAQPFLFRLQVLMTVTLAAGITGLLIMSRRTDVQEVYVERMRQQQKKEEADKQAEGEKKKEESWITDLLTGKAPREELYKNVFERLCKKTEAVAGAFYLKEKNQLTLAHHFALALGESQKISYENGEGLVGQAAKSQKKMVINKIPENSLRVVSGLGESRPRHLIIIPLVSAGETVAVSEIGMFREPDKNTVKALEEAHLQLAAFIQPDKQKAKSNPAPKNPKGTEL